MIVLLKIDAFNYLQFDLWTKSSMFIVFPKQNIRKYLCGWYFSANAIPWRTSCGLMLPSASRSMHTCLMLPFERQAKASKSCDLLRYRKNRASVFGRATVAQTVLAFMDPTKMVLLFQPAFRPLAVRAANAAPATANAAVRPEAASPGAPWEARNPRNCIFGNERHTKEDTLQNLFQSGIKFRGNISFVRSTTNHQNKSLHPLPGSEGMTCLQNPKASPVLVSGRRQTSEIRPCKKILRYSLVFIVRFYYTILYYIVSITLHYIDIDIDITLHCIILYMKCNILYIIYIYMLDCIIFFNIL